MKKLVLPTLFVSAIALAIATAQVLAEPKLGEAAPDWSLTDTNGKTHRLSDFRGKYVVLEWTNHQCPVVVRHYRAGNMQATQKWAKEKGVVWLSIVSSRPGSQGYVEPAQANEVIKEKGHVITAMLLDPSGTVGRKYGAKTTPHMYVIDPKGILIYNGAIDDNPSARTAEEMKAARNHVVMALTESMAGKPVSVPASQPYGCSVKY
jgi:peroxiredoxin